jgi:hypothetical protein
MPQPDAPARCGPARCGPAAQRDLVHGGALDRSAALASRRQRSRRRDGGRAGPVPCQARSAASSARPGGGVAGTPGPYRTMSWFCPGGSAPGGATSAAISVGGWGSTSVGACGDGSSGDLEVARICPPPAQAKPVISHVMRASLPSGPGSCQGQNCPCRCGNRGRRRRGRRGAGGVTAAGTAVRQYTRHARRQLRAGQGSRSVLRGSRLGGVDGCWQRPSPWLLTIRAHALLREQLPPRTLRDAQRGMATQGRPRNTSVVGRIPDHRAERGRSGPSPQSVAMHIHTAWLAASRAVGGTAMQLTPRRALDVCAPDRRSARATGA